MLHSKQFSKSFITTSSQVLFLICNGNYFQSHPQNDTTAFSNKLAFKSNALTFFKYNDFIILINECFIMFKLKNTAVDHHHNFTFSLRSYLYHTFLLVIQDILRCVVLFYLGQQIKMLVYNIFINNLNEEGDIESSCN